MRKQALALVGASAILLSLVGCSGGTSGGSKATEISYAHWGNQAEADTIATMVKAFEKAHPSITVDDQWLQGDYEAQVRTAIAGGKAPTVFQVSDQSVRSFATSLQDVEVTPSAYYNDNAANTMKVSKAYKAVPFVAKPKVLLYNGKLLDAAGVPRPSADTPMTTEQFVDAAKKLTSGSGAKKVFGSAPLWFEGFLSVNKTGFFNQAGTKCLLDSTKVIDTAKMVISAQKADGYVPTPDEAQGQDMFQWLSTGRVAMQPDFGPWDIAKLAALGDPDINVAPDPGGGEPLEIDGLGITKDSKAAETKAATTFINFMSTSTQAQNLLTTKKSSLGVPVIEKSVESFKANAPDLNLAAFVTAVGQNASPVAVPNKGEILKSFWDTANAKTGLGSGSDDPATVFPTLQSGCQSSLDKLIKSEK